MRSPLVRCGACGESPAPNQTLRRGRCHNCYDAWVRARPIGLGASCGGCAERRLLHLRYYEINLRSNTPDGRWIVLCHNCCAAADRLMPAPRSIEGLRMRLGRDRRWGDRRAEAVGGRITRDGGIERRLQSRRTLPMSGETFELSDDELVIELEADYEEVGEDQIAGSEEVTGIHFRLDALPPSRHEA